jgi:hypothetical protein
MISDKPRKRRPVALLQHVAWLFVIATIPRQRGTSVARHARLSYPVLGLSVLVAVTSGFVMMVSSSAAERRPARIVPLTAVLGAGRGRSLERFLTLTGLFAAKNILPRLPIGSM